MKRLKNQKAKNINNKKGRINNINDILELTKNDNINQNNCSITSISHEEYEIFENNYKDYEIELFNKNNIQKQINNREDNNIKKEEYINHKNNTQIGEDNLLKIQIFLTIYYLIM